MANLNLSHAAVRAVQSLFYQRKAQKNPVARTLVQKEIARAVYVVLKERTSITRSRGLSKRKASQWPQGAPTPSTPSGSSA